MKNAATIHARVTADREAWFAYRRTLSENLATLESIYRASLDGRDTPARTVAEFIKTVGKESAVEIIASLVNRSAWDGRIYPDVKAWAQGFENAWDEESSIRLGLYSNAIHMAHLNQIAGAMMRATA